MATFAGFQCSDETVRYIESLTEIKKKMSASATDRVNKMAKYFFIPVGYTVPVAIAAATYLDISWLLNIAVVVMWFLVGIVLVTGSVFLFFYYIFKSRGMNTEVLDSILCENKWSGAGTTKHLVKLWWGRAWGIGVVLLFVALDRPFLAGLDFVGMTFFWIIYAMNRGMIKKRLEDLDAEFARRMEIRERLKERL